MERKKLAVDTASFFICLCLNCFRPLLLVSASVNRVSRDGQAASAS